MRHPHWAADTSSHFISSVMGEPRISSHFLPTLRVAVFFFLALLCAPATASGVTSDASVARGQTFDYIVVGAGLGGTAVATRLSEDPSITVLVIEAGGDDRASPNVYDIYNYRAAFGTPLDWQWPTDQGKLIRG